MVANVHHVKQINITILLKDIVFLVLMEKYTTIKLNLVNVLQINKLSIKDVHVLQINPFILKIRNAFSVRILIFIM